MVRPGEMYSNIFTTPTVPGELSEIINNATMVSYCHVTAQTWCFGKIPWLWDLFRKHATAVIVNPYNNIVASPLHVYNIIQLSSNRGNNEGTSMLDL